MARKPADKRAVQADADGVTTSAGYGAAKPSFDVTKVEGFIPIEQFKNGWTLPEYDPDNPEHVRAARSLAELVVRVQQRQRAEKRASAEADAVAMEPKFVRVQRSGR